MQIMEPILVLGKEKDFDQPLSSLGKVTPVDITIPKPADKGTAAATPESTARGKALLAAVPPRRHIRLPVAEVTCGGPGIAAALDRLSEAARAIWAVAR